MVFGPFWSEIGYRFWPFWPEIGWGLCTLIWDLVWFLQEAIFLLIFFSKELRLDWRWEFEALLKCLCKQKRVRVWSEIGWGKSHILVWNRVRVTRSAPHTPPKSSGRNPPPLTTTTPGAPACFPEQRLVMENGLHDSLEIWISSNVYEPCPANGISRWLNLWVTAISF